MRELTRRFRGSVWLAVTGMSTVILTNNPDIAGTSALKKTFVQSWNDEKTQSMDTDSLLTFAGHIQERWWRRNQLLGSSANICAAYPTPGFTLDKGSESVDWTKRSHAKYESKDVWCIRSSWLPQSQSSDWGYLCTSFWNFWASIDLTWWW